MKQLLDTIKSAHLKLGNSSATGLGVICLTLIALAAIYSS